MIINKQHIINSNKLLGKMKPEYITIHSTGNERSTAQNERDNLNRKGNTNSIGFHYVVGDDVIIECIPPTIKTHHTGSKEGNNKSIGIEMVHTGDRQKVIDNTIKLVKHLQGVYGISSGNVVRHYDWSYKNCPSIMSANSWGEWWRFKKQILLLDVVNDLPDVWAVDSWNKATDKGLVDGSRPKECLTRQELTIVLDRLGVL